MNKKILLIMGMVLLVIPMVFAGETLDNGNTLDCTVGGFLICDDFSDGSINASLYNLGDAGEFTESGDKLTITTMEGTAERLYTDDLFLNASVYNWTCIVKVQADDVTDSLYTQIDGDGAFGSGLNFGYFHNSDLNFFGVQSHSINNANNISYLINVSGTSYLYQTWIDKVQQANISGADAGLGSNLGFLVYYQGTGTANFYYWACWKGQPDDMPVYTPPPPVDTFTITALDYYDSGALTNFTAHITNETYSVNYSTTNGTLPLTDVTSGIYNVTIESNEAGGYFNVSYSDYDVSDDLAAKLYQSILYLNASEIISGIKISSFTAATTTKVNHSNSSGLATLYIKAGTYAITGNNTNYHNTSKSVTIAALEEKTETLEFYTSLLSVNATVLTNGSKINDFTIYLTGINITYSAENTTTTGLSQFKLITGKYEINFSGIGYQKANQSITILSTDKNPNATFNLYTYNSINISIYDEIFGRTSFFINRPVYLEFSSDIDSYNYSTNTSQLYIDLLSPVEYRIHYYSNDYTPRDYYFTVNNNTHNTLELYLLSTGNSTDVTFTILDESGNELESALVYLMRYYITTNTYRTVAIGKTNIEGETIINVDYNDAYYQILATYGDYQTQTVGAKIFTTTPSITISTTTDIYNDIDTIEGVTTTLSYNNVTKTFSYSFVSTSGAVQGILTVDKITPSGSTVICSNTDTSASATILCKANATGSHDYFVGSGYINITNPPHLTNVLDISEWLEQGRATFGDMGVFISILFAGTFAALGTFNPVVMVVMFLAGLLGVVFFGFSALSISMYVAIAIIGGVIAYKMRR